MKAADDPWKEETTRIQVLENGGIHLVEKRVAIREAVPAERTQLGDISHTKGTVLITQGRSELPFRRDIVSSRATGRCSTQPWPQSSSKEKHLWKKTLQLHTLNESSPIEEVNINTTPEDTCSSCLSEAWPSIRCTET